MRQQRAINKTMDLSDLELGEAKKVIAELNALVLTLKEKGLKISSWYGLFDLTGDPTSFERMNRGYNYEPLKDAVDDKNFPWFLYWEIVWVVLNANFGAYHKVLDLGGSSSLFSFYLASKGLDVTTVDLQKSLVDNANLVAQQMDWNLRNFVMDMRELDFDSRFDHVTSICVYEHIPMYDRVKINNRVKNLLITGGRFSITFDYRNPSRFARINSPNDVCEQFIIPSGLSIRGNQGFVDTGQNYLLHPFYHPGISWKYKVSEIRKRNFGPWQVLRTKRNNDYTFGALFLERR